MNLPRYHGIIPPMVTPLRDRDALDVPGLERLIEHILDGGLHGLFILGTTGEGPDLSCRLRKELIERTCRLVNRRVPVLVGITDTAIQESLNVARWSADAGAQGHHHAAVSHWRHRGHGGAVSAVRSPVQNERSQIEASG